MNGSCSNLCAREKSEEKCRMISKEVTIEKSKKIGKARSKRDGKSQTTSDIICKLGVYEKDILAEPTDIKRNGQCIIWGRLS